MGSVQDLISLAQVKLGQRGETAERVGEAGGSIAEMIGAISKKRKDTEKKTLLWDIINKQEAEGKIVPEYDVSAEGDISIKYKPPSIRQSFTNAVNKAAQRIKAGEKISQNWL